MPVILPSPDELAHMHWHSRRRAVMAAERLVAAYHGAPAPTPAPPLQQSPSEREASKRRRQQSLIDWGQSVRAEARELAGEL
jgi:hypothetical protein